MSRPTPETCETTAWAWLKEAEALAGDMRYDAARAAASLARTWLLFSRGQEERMNPEDMAGMRYGVGEVDL